MFHPKKAMNNAKRAKPNGIELKTMPAVLAAPPCLSGILDIAASTKPVNVKPTTKSRKYINNQNLPPTIIMINTNISKAIVCQSEKTPNTREIIILTLNGNQAGFL